MTKQERYEVFEGYLRGTLDGLAVKDLEYRLEAEPDLRKEFELHKGVHQAIGDKKLRYFSELVQESEARYFSEEQQKSQPFFKSHGQKLVTIAATLLIGVMAYLFLFPAPTPAELFTTHFEPYTAPGTFRSEDLTEVDNDFILALVRYDEGQYAEAADFFSKTLNKNPNKDVAIFLRGVSYLSADSLDLAEADFKAVIANEESLFQEQAKWYLSLLYLKRGDEGAARRVLEEMERTERVGEVLDDLGE